MQITNRPQPDPSASLHVADVYMRWALQAAEEVTGKQGFAIVLRSAGLERFLDQPPSNQLKISGSISYTDYTNLCTGLMEFYGRAGKSMVMRIGRVSTRYAIEQQGGLYNVAALLAAKVMPAPIQIKIVLENMQSGLRRLHKAFGEDLHMRVEDRGDRWAYIAEECPSCAGKCADVHICWLFTGNIQEGVHWMTGKDFPVEEVECRAMDAPACVWEVSKTPKE